MNNSNTRHTPSTHTHTYIYIPCTLTHTLHTHPPRTHTQTPCPTSTLTHLQVGKVNSHFTCSLPARVCEGVCVCVCVCSPVCVPVILTFVYIFMSDSQLLARSLELSFSFCLWFSSLLPHFTAEQRDEERGKRAALERSVASSVHGSVCLSFTGNLPSPCSFPFPLPLSVHALTSLCLLLLQAVAHSAQGVDVL